ncbi:MAG TPA: GMP/IMP nucleotidase [Candidatus Competibacteraceae bacterium]|mgnify:FL=1|nr:GMP/IMP nucleotidase [Candidatus Competibacteraceae bacterium]MCP5132529.1 GMP/IMP nucleotidase [Gammaproteobacteria bacterium]HPF57853.1 GMP/IMP nucleotidase [Candidatus Competibacteraceae bacterium]HRY17324.1 GMP/IMP nucleotidase [Candidatus Competibacteraceae bacterium]
MTLWLPWPEICTVLLDMDGTLLDLHFDNYFWRELIPKRYAERHAVSLDQAHAEVKARTQAVEGTLDWYCLDYWTRELALDVVALKREIEHLIAVHPHALEFLDALRATGKRVILVTNAHPHSLSLKMEKTQLTGHFDAMICAHDLGLVKEQPEFWPRLQQIEAFNPAATLLVDDNLSILHTAQDYGIAYVVSVLRPDSIDPPRTLDRFPAIQDFSDLLPIV